MNPNKIYFKISQKEKETFYEYNEEKTYGAPLLKISERRM